MEKLKKNGLSQANISNTAFGQRSQQSPEMGVSQWHPLTDKQTDIVTL